MTTPDAKHCLVFDSGMGGLTIVQELQRLGFSGQISYAADTGAFPYGDKSDKVLTLRVPRATHALCDALKPDILVIACNTASTLALSIVRAVLSIPVVGTVPAIKPASKQTQTGVIGLLATPGTLRRAYTDALVHEFARDLTVLTHGSVELVELAERVTSGETVDDSEILTAIEPLLKQDSENAMDCIVLACTHFPLLKSRIQHILRRDIALIDSGEAIARRTMSLLGQPETNTIQSNLSRFLSTSSQTDNQRLQHAAERFGFQSFETLDVTD